MRRFQLFFNQKGIIISAKRYGVDALGALAQGLFCSLLIGTIFNTLGAQLGIPLFVEMGSFATAVSAPVMAISVGYALQAPPLVLFSLAAVGQAANTVGGAGGPLSIFLVTILVTELGKAVSKETKVDILVTPAVTVGVGVLLSWLIARPIGLLAEGFGVVVNRATALQPFWMGIIVSVLVGMALTLPISSAAICHTIGLVGLAGGAAVAGCCAQMVGFAVLSFRENGWSGIVSQGLGTSMLQMPNIIKNPRIWIPTILTSAITGALSTCVFQLQMNGEPIYSGMGTCGLCGPIGIWIGWLNPSQQGVAMGAESITPSMFHWWGLLLICFVLPAILTWAFGCFFRRIGWIKSGDLKLP